MEDEVINGPGGIDIVVPAEVPEIRPGGFILRLSQLDEIVLEMFGPAGAPTEQSVIARLVFANHGFQRFVEALRSVQHDLNIGNGNSRTT